MIPGGSRRNLAYADTWTRWEPGVTELQRTAATDAQTSGGLLLAASPRRLDDLCGRLSGGGDVAAPVGRLVDAAPGSVTVVAGG